MADWKYNPENYDPDSYKVIPPGEYRVRIEDCEEKFSKSGKPMYRLTLSVSGYSAHVWYYLVFDATDEKARKWTDQRLGSVYDSFNIPRGNMNVYDWKGKTGGAKICNRPDDKGELRSDVHYFLPREKVEALPEWREGNSKGDSQDKDDFSPQTFNPEEGFVNSPTMF